MRKFLLPVLLFLSVTAFAAISDVSVVSFKGPIGTTKISPPNGSTSAYIMNFPGQKSVCFKTYTATEVFLSTGASVGANGYPLTSKGDTFCADLLSGTTIYLYGNGVGADVRAIFAR